MFETIGVLIIFFFLLVATAAVYFQLQQTSYKKQLRQQAELESFNLAQRALHLPELDCSFASIQKENCFDSYKIAALSNLLKNEETTTAYYPTFGYSDIVITQHYPERAEYTLYSNQPPRIKGILPSSTPVLIYNATTDTHSYGIIDIKLYEQ